MLEHVTDAKCKTMRLLQQAKTRLVSLLTI